MNEVVFVDTTRRARRIILRTMQVIGVFLLLFALGMGRSVVGYVHDGVRMPAWQEVPMTVLTAEYRQRERDEGPHFVAEYRYRFHDVDYTGTRVEMGDPYLTVLNTSDVQSELMQHLTNGTPTVGYVNPDRPAEAVLRRNFSYMLLSVILGMCAALTLGGGLFFLGARFRLRTDKDEARRQELHPAEPWLWRDDWANKRIRSRSGVDTRILVVVAALYLVVVVPLGLLVLREKGIAVWSVPGAVLLVLGFILFRLAWQKWKKGKVLDVAEFRLAKVPGLVGGPLAGVVTMPASLPNDVRYRVRLECWRAGDGNREAGTVWRDATVVQRTIAADPYTRGVPIYFAIPYYCTPCSPDNPGLRWKLRVGPEQGYLEDDAEFEVPVFRTAASSPKYVAEPQLMEGYEAVVTPEKALEESGCRMQTLVDGREELRFSLFRFWLLVAAAVMIGGCATAIVAVIYYQWHWGWTVLPALFGVLVVLGTLEMLLWGSRLRIGPDDVEVRAGLLGFRRTERLKRAQIRSIETAVEFAQEKGDKFLVRLEPYHGRPLVIVKRLESRQAGEAVRRLLCEKLGLVEQATTV